MTFNTKCWRAAQFRTDYKMYTTELLSFNLFFCFLFSMTTTITTITTIAAIIIICNRDLKFEIPFYSSFYVWPGTRGRSQVIHMQRSTMQQAMIQRNQSETIHFKCIYFSFISNFSIEMKQTGRFDLFRFILIWFPVQLCNPHWNFPLKSLRLVGSVLKLSTDLPFVMEIRFFLIVLFDFCHCHNPESLCDLDQRKIFY